jgi:hypothetical protein
MSMMRRIGNLFSRSKLDDDMEAELRAHVQMRTEENLRWGMSEREARHDALVRFGCEPGGAGALHGDGAAGWRAIVGQELL